MSIVIIILKRPIKKVATKIETPVASKDDIIDKQKLDITSLSLYIIWFVPFSSKIFAYSNSFFKSSSKLFFLITKASFSVNNAPTIERTKDNKS